MGNRTHTSYGSGDVSSALSAQFWDAVGKRGITPEVIQRTKDEAQKCNQLTKFWLELFGGMQVTGLPAEEIIKKFSGRIPIYKPRQTSKLWNCSIPENILVPYTEETIEWCITENKKSEDWRLVFYTGTSDRSQREIISIYHQPCFDEDNIWWLDEDEDNWTNATSPARFWLINLKPKFPRLTWRKQEEEIKKLGKQTGMKIIRCPGNPFRETVFDAFHFNGGERITGGVDRWYHWGKEITFFGEYVYSGHFDEVGLSLSADHPEYSDGYLRVVLALEPDFN